MCSGRISVKWVGLVHLQNTQDPHIQSTCYYSSGVNRQITFHMAQRMSVCSHRDRKKSSHTFIVTPRGIFLNVIFRSLTDIFCSIPIVQIWCPPAPFLTTPPKSQPSPPPPPLSPVLGKQGGTLVSVVKLAARDRTLNEWFKVSSEQLSQLINLLMAVHVRRGARGFRGGNPFSVASPFQVKTATHITVTPGWTSSSRAITHLFLWKLPVLQVWPRLLSSPSDIRKGFGQGCGSLMPSV